MFRPAADVADGSAVCLLHLRQPQISPFEPIAVGEEIGIILLLLAGCFAENALCRVICQAVFN